MLGGRLGEVGGEREGSMHYLVFGVAAWGAITLMFDGRDD